MSEIHDTTACELGEGPLWHPERRQLFWFDILGRRLHSRERGKTRTVQFAEHVSAAGWVDGEHLLIASETRLFLFNVERERSEDVEGLESADATTRSNDGRADPWGGFWIGTMSKTPPFNGQGAIYRYHGGELRRLHANVSIPNAICFAPDAPLAYFADTPTQKIMRQSLDPDTGWPVADPELWLDLAPGGWQPDGAIVDAEGNLWNAQWGAGRVACYDPEGNFLHAVAMPASQTTCPAFGGEDLTTLFCTSALMRSDQGAPSESHGMTFAVHNAGQGQAEHRVVL